MGKGKGGIGIGKSSHWGERRRIKNATRKQKKMLSTLTKPESIAKIKEKCSIGRKREIGKG